MSLLWRHQIDFRGSSLFHPLLMISFTYIFKSRQWISKPAIVNTSLLVRYVVLLLALPALQMILAIEFSRKLSLIQLAIEMSSRADCRIGVSQDAKAIRGQKENSLPLYVIT